MNKDNSLSYRIFYIGIYIILAIISLSAIIPFILSVIVSLTDEKTIIMNGYSFFPEKFSTESYRMVFGENWVFNAYKVTIIVTVVGTFLCVVFSAMIGYAISLQKIKYRNVIAMYLFIPMVFSAGLVPWYLWVSGTLHLKNSIWALILPGMINPFWIFLMRNFFKTIPVSLSESAEIDGAGPVYTFFKIILPLSKPIVATIILFASLRYWNDYINALWLIDKQELYPLQFMLYKLKSLITYMTEHAGNASEGNAILPTEGIQFATFIIVLGPIILVYPAVQKYFVKGIMIGAVKG